MISKPDVYLTNRTVYAAAVFFVMAISSLLILLCSGPVMAQGSMPVDKGILGGQIVGISNVSNMPTVTLRLGNSPSNLLNIFLNKDTKLQVCNESYPLMWTDNRNATVTYHEVAGVVIADSIYEKC